MSNSEKLDNQNTENERGVEPAGPPLLSVSEGAQMPFEERATSFPISACITFKAIDDSLQDPNQFSDSDIVLLRGRISPRRLTVYDELASGDNRFAIRLHTWNAAVAASLMPSLQIAEVIIRNFAEARLASRFKSEWYSDATFRFKMKKSIGDLDLSLSEIRKNAKSSKEIRSKLIRDLSFGFWVNIFTTKLSGDIWNGYLSHHVRNLPRGYILEDLYRDIDNLRQIRNLSAHHRNLINKPSPNTPPERHETILKVIGYFSKEAEKYAEIVSPFKFIWDARPNQDISTTQNLQGR